MNTSVLQPDRPDADDLRAHVYQRRCVVRVSRRSSFRKHIPRQQKDEWDRQMEDDVEAGKLDDLAKKVKKRYREGKATRIA